MRPGRVRPKIDVLFLPFPSFVAMCQRWWWSFWPRSRPVAAGLEIPQRWRGRDFSRCFLGATERGIPISMGCSGRVSKCESSARSSRGWGGLAHHEDRCLGSSPVDRAKFSDFRCSAVLRRPWFDVSRPHSDQNLRAVLRLFGPSLGRLGPAFEPQGRPSDLRGHEIPRFEVAEASPGSAEKLCVFGMLSCGVFCSIIGSLLLLPSHAGGVSQEGEEGGKDVSHPL